MGAHVRTSDRFSYVAVELKFSSNETKKKEGELHLAYTLYFLTANVFYMQMLELSQRYGPLNFPDLKQEHACINITPFYVRIFLKVADDQVRHKILYLVGSVRTNEAQDIMPYLSVNCQNQ